MPCQFENRYTLTDEMVLEYVSQVCCKSLLRGCFLVFSFAAGLCLLFSCLHKQIPAAIAAFFAATSLISGLSIPVFFLHSHSVPSQNGPKHETVVRFGEQIQLTENGRNDFFDYKQLSKICVFRTFYVLHIATSEVIVLSAFGFPSGELIPFWRFIREKRPDLKIEASAKLLFHLPERSPFYEPWASAENGS